MYLWMWATAPHQSIEPNHSSRIRDIVMIRLIPNPWNKPRTEAVKIGMDCGFPSNLTWILYQNTYVTYKHLLMYSWILIHQMIINNHELMLIVFKFAWLNNTYWNFAYIMSHDQVKYWYLSATALHLMANWNVRIYHIMKNRNKKFCFVDA
jgi:hypothetical protein